MLGVGSKRGLTGYLRRRFTRFPETRAISNLWIDLDQGDFNAEFFEWRNC